MSLAGNQWILSREQLRVLDKIIEGAEIQINMDMEQITFVLCEPGGDISPIRRATFERLSFAGLIKLKWRPSIDVERWG